MKKTKNRVIAAVAIALALTGSSVFAASPAMAATGPSNLDPYSQAFLDYQQANELGLWFSPANISPVTGFFHADWFNRHLTSTPENPVEMCASVGDPAIMTWKQARPLPPGVVPPLANGNGYFDVIQWEVQQNGGTATFDVANSDCGKLWGITADDVMIPTRGAEKWTTASAGKITMDIDAYNDNAASGGPGWIGSGVSSAHVIRSDGSMVTVQLNSRKLPAPPPPPTTTLSGVPFSTSVQVGDPLSITAQDLLKNASLSTTGDFSLSSFIVETLPGSTLDEVGSGFDWTPDTVGAFTFKYVLIELRSSTTSDPLVGTITVTAAPALAADPVPPVATPEPAPASRLAETGLDAGSLLALFLGLIISGLTVVIATRRKSAE